MGRRGMDSDYAPFEGMVFTDTFNLGEGEGISRKPYPSTVSALRGSRAGTLRSLWAIRLIPSDRRAPPTKTPM